jgi:hypothetical protein
MHRVFGITPSGDDAVFADQIDHQKIATSINESNYVADLKRG